MGSMIWKLVGGALGLVVVLAAVLVVKTLLIGPPPGGDIRAADEISIDKDIAAQRLGQSVRFRTISYGSGAPIEKRAFRELHGFLMQSYPNVHVGLKRETVGDYSLLYTWKGSDPTLRRILFLAHMDVVPVEPGTEANWTHPPFSGDVADGFIWGRGTLDMKHSLMGLLEAVEHLLGLGFAPKRTVYFAFGHDEEIGGWNGAAKIAKILEELGVRLYYSLDEGSVITLDIVPGVAKPVALIGLAEKGYVTLELTAQAKGGHSSMPPRSTAVGKLARAIHRLETNQMPAMLRSPASEMFKILAPEMSFGTRLVLANRWLLDSALLAFLAKSPATNAVIRTTTAPTIVKGGIKPNVLPSQVKATINFRILPGDTVDTVIEHTRKVIDDPDVAVHRVGTGIDPSPVSDSGSASFAALEKTVRQIFPDAVVAPSLVIVHTDTKHFGNVADNSYRFLPMRVGPKDLARIHGTDERISVDNYAEIIRFYIQLMRNTAAP